MPWGIIMSKNLTCLLNEDLKKLIMINIDKYKIDCTGDVCVGDEITIVRAVFRGSYRKPKFSHNERLFLKVVKDSYGKEKQQHTFTCLNIETNQKILIKGRNVYRNGTMRKPWKDEELRNKTLDEKHERGDKARFMRDWRKSIY